MQTSAKHDLMPSYDNNNNTYVKNFALEDQSQKHHFIHSLYRIAKYPQF